MDNTVIHPKLKVTFRGVHHPHSSYGSEFSVTQFRGIKFASIPTRWRKSKLFESYPEGVYDATQYGPVCPQAKRALAAEEAICGISKGNMPAIKLDQPDWWIDELECLNLNITVPTRRTGPSALNGQESLLPVIICVHGGGLFSGRNSSWFVDGGSIAAKGIRVGKPIIFVTLNYRLGSLGFLASDELLRDNRAAGDDGVGNYGAYDLHLGIEWIYRNILPFGGDPNNITIMGESGGGRGVLMQVHSLLQPRFKRAIIQSAQIDSASLAIPATLEEHESFYEVHKKFFNAQTLDELRALPASAFDNTYAQLQRPGEMLFRMTIDGIYCGPNWRDGTNMDGLDLVVGDTAHEQSPLQLVGSAASKRPFGSEVDGENHFELESFFTRLSSQGIQEAELQKIHAVLKKFGIAQDLTAKEANPRLWEIVSDLSYGEPTQRYATSTNLRYPHLRLYRYLFDEINPFKGTPFFSTQANHALDLLYLYGPGDLFDSVENPKEERSIVNDIQEKWLGFAHGEHIWKPFNEGGYYCFGPRGFTGEIAYGEVKRRRRTDKWPVFDSLTAKERWDLAVNITQYLVGM